jgi:cytochrome b561
LRKLQSEQAVTTLIHVVCPPREPGFGWTGGVHTLLAYYGRLMLITLHVAAGNYHYFVRRDGVLQRMLPGR